MGGNCSNCGDTLTSTHDNEIEYNVDNRMPISFIYGVDKEDENKEILVNAFHFLKDLDTGKNKPGEAHIPDESETIKHIKVFPQILKDLFTCLQAKFGYFDSFDKSSRPDNYKTKMGFPVEILVIKKEGRTKEEEISLHPLKKEREDLSAINIEFKHRTPTRRSRREITVNDFDTQILGSDLHEYYEGEWRKMKYHGYGRLVTVQGHAYEGFFAKGLPWGKGRIYFNNGYYFNGYFEQGVFSGKGELYSNKGSVFQGEFVKGMMEGRGFETYYNGTTFEGNYKNGKRNGRGVLVLVNEMRIEGDFENNFLEGEANIKYVNGDKFEGHFVGNRRHGRGTFEYKNGRKFEGNYRFDLRWGEGLIHFPNGAKLKGEWDGEAEYTDSKGKEYTLTFVRGRVKDKKNSDIPSVIDF